MMRASMFVYVSDRQGQKERRENVEIKTINLIAA